MKHITASVWYSHCELLFLLERSEGWQQIQPQSRDCGGHSKRSFPLHMLATGLCVGLKKKKSQCSLIYMLNIILTEYVDVYLCVCVSVCA